MPGVERKAWSSDITTVIKIEQGTEEGVCILPGVAASRFPDGTTVQEEMMACIEEEAESMLRGARERAQAILRDAEGKLEELEEEARERGWESGRREGYREGRRTLVEVSERLEEQFREMRERDQRRWEGLGSELAAVVVEAVEKVLRREFTNGDAALHLIKEGLRRFSDVSDITLVVSPGDMGETLERRSELEDVIPPRTELILLTDAGLGRGEFRLRGQEGVFEGTVSDLIASLRRHMGEERVADEERA